MTVVVIILLPVVLAYQTWTYYVFWRRVSRQDSSRQRRPPEPSRSRNPGLLLPRSGLGAQFDRPSRGEARGLSAM